MRYLLLASAALATSPAYAQSDPAPGAGRSRAGGGRLRGRERRHRRHRPPPRREASQDVPLADLGGRRRAARRRPAASTSAGCQQLAADAAVLFDQPAQHRGQHPRPRRAVRPDQRRHRAGRRHLCRPGLLQRASPPRRSTSSMSSRSRCCAGRRARSTARTPPPARSTSPPARRPSTSKAAPSSRVGNLDFMQAKASVSGPARRRQLAVRLARLGDQPPRHDLQRHHRPAGSTSRTISACAASCCGEPTDDLDLTLSGDYNRQDPECCAPDLRAHRRRPSGRSTASIAALAAAFGYAPPSTDPFDRLTDLDAAAQRRQEHRRRRRCAREWDVGPGTLTSVTAWRFWDWGPSNDRDFTGLPITTVSQNPSQQDQYSQELRYAVDRRAARLSSSALFGFTRRIDTTGAQEQGAGGEPLAAQSGERRSPTATRADA